MKKPVSLFFAMMIIMSTVSMLPLKVHASDYKGEENRGSVFQVLGDLITGNYKVDGKPLKEKGWFQVSADATKNMKQESMDNTKSEGK
jgi:hypothetical protein